MCIILLLDALEPRLHGRLLDGDLVVHSDRRPRQFTTRCAGHLAAGAPPQIASVGAAQYDALAETVIGHFKAEVLHRDGPWWGFESVGRVMLEWVAWFNQER